jgi:hypothetical protein
MAIDPKIKKKYDQLSKNAERATNEEDRIMFLQKRDKLVEENQQEQTAKISPIQKKTLIFSLFSRKAI